MTSNLAENIRNLRKTRKLTQEQLAEVVGVTTGAVHKWEIGASVPELGMLMELADFFDVSVDVLIGYRMKDNRIEATLKRLAGYCRTMDPEALTEAEKALKKYPNSFDIVCGCASVYLVYAIGNESKEPVRRSLELLDRALELLPGNTDPKHGEIDIYGMMANAYQLLGEDEKALELMKQHNVRGTFSGSIGVWLAAYLKRYDEAEEYLSGALVQGVSDMLDAIMGFYAVFCARRDYESATDLIRLAESILDKVIKEGKVGFFSKSKAMLFIMLANIQQIKGEEGLAGKSMDEAVKITRSFDRNPDYSLNSIRFVRGYDGASFHDLMGKTAEESARAMLGMLENKELTEMWERRYSDE